MKMHSALGVSLLVLIAVSSAGAQNVPYSSPGRALVPAPAGQGMTAPQGTYPPQGYGVQPQPQPAYQGQSPASSAGAGEWPYYPYPPYHNPYYDQRMSVRDALSGTIDWFFALPSNLMDRVSGFLDGRVFPQMPATRGAQPAPQAPVQSQPSQENAPALPQARQVAPTPR